MIVIIRPVITKIVKTGKYIAPKTSIALTPIPVKNDYFCGPLKGINIITPIAAILQNTVHITITVAMPLGK